MGLSLEDENWEYFSCCVFLRSFWFDCGNDLDASRLDATRYFHMGHTFASRTCEKM